MNFKQNPIKAAIIKNVGRIKSRMNLVAGEIRRFRAKTSVRPQRNIWYFFYVTARARAQIFVEIIPDGMEVNFHSAHFVAFSSLRVVFLHFFFSVYVRRVYQVERREKRKREKFAISHKLTATRGEETSSFKALFVEITQWKQSFLIISLLWNERRDLWSARVFNRIAGNFCSLLTFWETFFYKIYGVIACSMENRLWFVNV